MADITTKRGRAIERQRLLAYIVARTQRVGDCWEWTGATNGVGYGVMHPNGRTIYVHRHLYTRCVAPIPAGYYVDHLCRNTLCCNPEHLEAVTPSENTRRSPLIGQKVRCKHGHLFDEANTYITPAGARQCRACSQRRARADRQRRK